LLASPYYLYQFLLSYGFFQATHYGVATGKIIESDFSFSPACSVTTFTIATDDGKTIHAFLKEYEDGKGLEGQKVKFSLGWTYKVVRIYRNNEPQEVTANNFKTFEFI